MENLRKDVYGRTVEVGDFVVVNYSGYLAIGEVKDLPEKMLLLKFTSHSRKKYQLGVTDNLHIAD